MTIFSMSVVQCHHWGVAGSMFHAESNHHSKFIRSELMNTPGRGFEDAEIYGMAIHYYEESEIEVGALPNCQVVVNHTVELTEEEREQARQDAINKLRDEEMAKMRRPIQPRKTAEKKATNVQPSLFDF